MNIMVTGNLGYIGTVLTTVLSEHNYDVTGFDTDYYRGCELTHFPLLEKQIRKDIRDITAEDLDGVDAVIHLAALSNDPLGEFDPSLTEMINYQSTIQLAEMAKASGVRRFIYSSSQSMYGVADSEEELEEDTSTKRPLTSYARTKWDAEVGLKELCSDEFTLVFFRPSTVFGWSPRLRCDIVFNNLVACAYTTGVIEIKSDGTPWRPVVHVRDVCNAYIAGLESPKALVSCRSFNVGIRGGNYTVRDLAEAAQEAVPGSTLIFTGEHGTDSRTYKVSFDRILSELKDYYKPEWNLVRGGRELVEYFDQVGFNEKMFRGKATNRLNQLKDLVDSQHLDTNLRWGPKSIQD